MNQKAKKKYPCKGNRSVFGGLKHKDSKITKYHKEDDVVLEELIFFYFSPGKNYLYDDMTATNQ